MRTTHPILTAAVLVVLIAVLPSASTVAGENDQMDQFDQRHQVGVRLGIWANGGETPPTLFEDPDEFYRVDTDINSANVYFEGVVAYRLYSLGLLEFSLGFVNRGDVNVRDGSREYFGSLIFYPILLQWRQYLPLTGDGKLRPYVSVGGGIYYGRNSVQFTNDAYYAFTEESQTDFSYVLGGGVDYRIANSIALELNAKYMPIDFSKNLILIRDYQAFTVTFGVKYLFTGGKDK